MVVLETCLDGRFVAICKNDKSDFPHIHHSYEIQGEKTGWGSQVDSLLRDGKPSAMMDRDASPSAGFLTLVAHVIGILIGNKWFRV